MGTKAFDWINDRIKIFHWGWIWISSVIILNILGFDKFSPIQDEAQTLRLQILSFFLLVDKYFSFGIVLSFGLWLLFSHYGSRTFKSGDMGSGLQLGRIAKLFRNTYILLSVTLFPFYILAFLNIKNIFSIVRGWEIGLHLLILFAYILYFGMTLGQFLLEDETKKQPRQVSE